MKHSTSENNENVCSSVNQCTPSEVSIHPGDTFGPRNLFEALGETRDRTGPYLRCAFSATVLDQHEQEPFLATADILAEALAMTDYDVFADRRSFTSSPSQLSAPRQ
jgi:hypothetical protein